MPRASPVDILGLGEIDERLQLVGDDLVAPRREAGLRSSRDRALARCSSASSETVGFSGSSVGSRTAISSSRHSTRPRTVQLEGVGLGGGDAAGAHAELARQHLRGGGGGPPCRGCLRPERRARSGSRSGVRR